MNQAGGISGPYAIIIGALLLVEGVWGLFSPVVFGVLTTNLTHAVIHILLGVAGIWTGWKGQARGYCLFLGALLLAVGILRFVPGVGEWVVSILNVNPAVAYVNIVIGIVSLMIAFLAGRSRVAGH